MVIYMLILRNQTLTTGEGGMVLTDDRGIHDHIVAIRDYNKKSLNVTRYNYKMTDIQAALVLSQLRKLQQFINRRRYIASLYSKRFSNCNFMIPYISSYKRSVIYRCVVLVDKLKHVQKLAKRNAVICERPVCKPLHRSFTHIKYPNSDYVYDRALSIPLYPSLNGKEVEYVVDKLLDICSRGT
jgi:dTDP-4-amino-4,6-dideoxygalactose transaminase